jgi:hypothetical protein
VSGLDVRGWGVRGSAAIHDRLYIQLSHINTDLNETNPNLRFDAESTSVGVGFIFDENATASVYGGVSYLKRKNTSRFTDESHLRSTHRVDGHELELGVRIQLVTEAELRLAVSHADLGRGGELTLPTAELVYKFLPNLAGVVNYTHKTNNDMIGLALRYYFD